MASQANPYISVDEYLEREAHALDRHEYLKGEIFLKAGGTLEHSANASNVIGALGSQLAQTDCIVRGSDARLRTSPRGSIPTQMQLSRVARSSRRRILS